jgi:isocitrate dehydrogenase kinase/phosphatase
MPSAFTTDVTGLSLKRSSIPSHAACSRSRDYEESWSSSVPYEDLDRDVASIVNEVNLFLWPLTRGETTFDAEILNEVFFRNKAAYIVGRLLAGARVIPLILPLYNDDGGIHVDAVLLTGGDVGSIFGFAYSPFHVVSAAPNDLVRFLRSILSRKPLSEIYNSIGFPKHGKTEFYADLHRYVHTTRERFVIAPGLEGAVMTVFTLPNHPYVFKVIKDRPCFLRSGQVTTKSITNAQVREKYRFVSGRDRVGRLVDTQEFEFLRFRRWRYSDPVLDELQQAARNAITFDGEHVIVHHCYIQRRVIPLPMYLEVERNPERIRRIVLDFGYFIKDLAGTGLFASDLFNKWNYGVTDRSRVVLYDYDDIMPLEHMRFRVKPLPRDDDEAWLAEEDRIAADEYDFFMDEIERWLGIPQQLRGIFDAVHADLYTPVFWDLCRKRLLRGEVADIYPYDRSKRFLLPPAFPSAGQPLH